MKSLKLKGFKGAYELNKQTGLYEGFLKNDPSQTFYGETKDELEEEFRQLVFSLLGQE